MALFSTSHVKDLAQVSQKARNCSPFWFSGSRCQDCSDFHLNRRSKLVVDCDTATKVFEPDDNGDRRTLALNPSYLRMTGAAEITAEKARGQVFEILKLQLAELPVPYFVPSNSSLSMLPVPTVSPAVAAKGASPQDLINRKIEARKKALKP